MKNLSLIFSLFLMTNLLGQHKITSLSELNEWNAREKANNLLKVNFDGKSYVDSVLILLNKYRVENGTKPLVLSENLCKVAELQSKYCADNLVITHEQDDEYLTNVFERGLKFNEREVMGEIIIQGSIDLLIYQNRTIPSFIVENFKTSRSHSSIMRGDDYVRCGISLVQSKEDLNRYYAVIVFSTN